ncbi:hypothetical protein D3C81_190600 [compost metagenome]
MANVISMENFLHTKKEIQQRGIAKVQELLVEKAAVDERMPTLPTVELREQAVIYSLGLLTEAHEIAKEHHFKIKYVSEGKYAFWDC